MADEGTMGDADLMSDSGPTDLQPAHPDFVPGAPPPGPSTVGPGDAEGQGTTDAEDRFDLLRAELRRDQSVERGWRDRRPWRWFFRRKCDPGAGPPG